MQKPRPALFDLGLLLTALHAALWVLLTLAGGVVVGIGAGLASVIEPGFLVPAAFAGGLAGLVAGALLSVSLLVLFACYKAHEGSRAWTWVLLAISVMGLLDPGLLSTPTRLITIVGIVQLLDRQRMQTAQTRPSDVGAAAPLP